MIIVVLSDGETYSEIKGCTIRHVQDDVEPEDIGLILKGIEGGYDSKRITIMANLAISERNLNG